MHSNLWRWGAAAAAAGQVRQEGNRGPYKSSEHENPCCQGCREPGWMSGQRPVLPGVFVLTDN